MKSKDLNGVVLRKKVEEVEGGGIGISGFERGKVEVLGSFFLRWNIVVVIIFFVLDVDLM